MTCSPLGSVNLVWGTAAPSRRPRPPAWRLVLCPGVGRSKDGEPDRREHADEPCVHRLHCRPVCRFIQFLLLARDHPEAQQVMVVEPFHDAAGAGVASEKCGADAGRRGLGAVQYTLRTMTSPGPLVAVIMGSTSDWETMTHAARGARALWRAARARTSCRPTARRCGWPSSPRGAEARGIEVIIAGAGGAAHLPGMVAAHTVLPVLGVPVQSAALQGLDSLLSIVQMPGGVPVGTLAIGKAGATNAGLLAVAILANSRPELREQLRAFREEQTAEGRARNSSRDTASSLPGATIGRARQRPARAHVRASPRGAWATASTPSRPIPTRRPGRSPTSRSTAAYDDLDALRAFARRVDVVTFEFENVPARPPSATESLVAVRPRPTRCTSRSSGRARSPSSPIAASRVRRSRSRRPPSELAVGARAASALPAIVKTAAFGLRRQGPAPDRPPSATGRAHLERARRPGGSRREARSRLQARALGDRGARAWTAQSRMYRLVREPPRQPHPRPLAAPAAVPPAVAARGHARSRAASSRSWTTSACSASSSSSAPTASCW